MGYANGIVSAPVGVYDVQRALGNGSPDVGTLCSGATINKWAKYKPVRWPNVNTLAGWDFVNNRWGSGALWWKAEGMCGMATEVKTEFGEPANSNSFAYKLINGQLGWAYQHPTGGSQQPFRLTDFAQYYHLAIQPYGEIGSTTIYINPTNNQAQIDWDITDVDPLNLSLSDLVINNHPLTDFYLGIILWKSATNYHLRTSSNKFAAGTSLSVVFDASGTSMPGEWNLMPFFSLYKTNQSDLFDANGLFVSMAETTPTVVTLTRQGVNRFDMPLGIWNQAGTRVNYEIDVINETSSNHTYDSIVVAIYGGSYSGTLLVQKTLSNVTVNAGSTNTLTGYVTATKSGYDSYWIVVRDGTVGSRIPYRYNQIEDYDGM